MDDEEIQKEIEEFEEELCLLQDKIGSVADTGSEKEHEIRKEMEILANKFGFTAWYEARRTEVYDDRYPYTDIKWSVFIPNNFDKEKVYHPKYLLRSFTFGESQGNEQGCWISSHSC
jgi:hypothetical protein